MRAQTAGQNKIDIAMMRAHNAGHDVTCHIIQLTDYFVDLFVCLID